MTTLERRHSERARIPCNIPVELTDAVRHAHFEADAVDLSVGGLSLRAAQLPAIGSQLFCSFEAMPGGAQVLGRGEVVWRQPEDQSAGGEFGLRFVEVDPKTQALIDEMVAERIARIEGSFRQSKPPELVLASLEIENVAAPVSARLLHTSETEALFEQTLEQFSVGKSVVAHAGTSLVRGHISSVKLRMEGSSPRLVLTLQMPRDPARFGEFEWGEPGSDTDPDIFDHAAEEHDEISDESLQIVEEEAEIVDEDDDVLPAYRRERSRTLSGLGVPDPSSPTGHSARSPIFAARHPATKAGLGAVGQSGASADADPAEEQLPLFDRPPGRRITLNETGSLSLNLDQLDQDDEPSAPERVFADEDAIMALLTSPQQPSAATAGTTQPDSDRDSTLPVYEEPSNAPMMRFLRVLARLQETGRKLGEHSRELTERARDAAQQRLSRVPKPRRVAAATAGAPATQQAGHLDRKATVRWLLIGSASLLALVALGYAMLPSASERYPTHGQDEEVADDGAARKDNEIVNVDPGAFSGTGPGKGHVSDISAATSPSHGSEARSDARNNVSPSTIEFGQRQIKNPKRFLLRMSEKVKALEGTAEPGGFSVLIPGNKAIDKAAIIIKAGHPAVATATIKNNLAAHSARLHVTFVPGKAPAFRVTGHGSALEILIEQ